MLVTTKATDGIVAISVVDQGIGIPTHEMDRIFERFYRVDPARHRSTGGTGLGLSIVKHVAATHGGEVRVWSVEGQGSTFTLTLPEHTGDHDADARRRRRRPGDVRAGPILPNRRRAADGPVDEPATHAPTSQEERP